MEVVVQLSCGCGHGRPPWMPTCEQRLLETAAAARKYDRNRAGMRVQHRMSFSSLQFGSLPALAHSNVTGCCATYPCTVRQLRPVLRCRCRAHTKAVLHTDAHARAPAPLLQRAAISLPHHPLQLPIGMMRVQVYGACAGIFIHPPAWVHTSSDTHTLNGAGSDCSRGWVRASTGGP